MHIFLLPMGATRPAHLFFFDFITPLIRGEECNSWSS
jgi:hypothetical protein